jgi:ubiquinone/menaquinone biosynthesis C-methylase UbiE
MNNDNVRESFGRQVETMSAAAVFNAQNVLGAIVQASGQGPGRRCIDVGCGPGIVLEALARRSGEVVGVDATPQMVHQAQERCQKINLANVQVLVGLGEELPFPNSHFDAAVSRVMLHHVKDANAVLSEMTRVLKPGGRLVVADVVSSDVPAESDLHNALEIIRDPSHTRMLPRSAFLALGQRQGLRPVEHRQWVQHRQFGEWMRIVNAPQREWLLNIVMKNLAQADQHAGIDLKCVGETITFDHNIWMLVLEKPSESHGR